MKYTGTQQTDDFSSCPWTPAATLNSRLWQMALWEQLHTTSIPINWRIFLDRNSQKSTVHLWRHFSVSQWTNPKLLTARSNRFLFGKECIPQELFKSRCTFLYLRQPLRIGRRGTGTFITQISREIGVKTCFVSGTHSEGWSIRELPTLFTQLLKAAWIWLFC